MLLKKVFAVILVAMFATMGTLVAQEKYAILIGGNMNPDDLVIPETEQWNGGQGGSLEYGFDEFWNDTYLMWEMLIKEDGGKGYTVDNVHVLFGENGNDFTFPLQWERYTAIHNYEPYVVDDNSNYQTIDDLFEDNLANTITEDDFLFVWIMGHGGSDATGHYFYSYDNHKIYDYELAGWLDGIAAHKKTVFLSFPKSGGFVPELEADDIIIITNGGATEGASRADDFAPGGVVFEENEVIEGITYNHGEINYHLTSALTGFTPKGEDEYNEIPLSTADYLPDGIIMMSEVYFSWLNIYQTSPEGPHYDNPLYYYCLGTSLEYPTVLIEEIWSGDQVTLRGLIAISNYLNVNPQASLTFTENSRVFLTPFSPDPMEVYFLDHSYLVIEDNVTIHSLDKVFEFFCSIGANVQIGDNVTFSSGGYDASSLVSFNSLNDNYHFNELNIINCNLEILAPIVEIGYSDFEKSRCRIESDNGDIHHCMFESSRVSMVDNFRCNISYCQFDNQLTGQNDVTGFTAIGLSNCNAYSIDQCSVTGYLKDAVKIYNSGYDPFSVHMIKDNTIENNGILVSVFNWTNLRVYNSYADIIDSNNIVDSEIGIQSINNSQVSIVGNRSARFVNEAQQIHDNSLYQIYATPGAFPYEVRWNAIYDEYNDCLFMYDTEDEEPPYDVAYNYWGGNFVPEDDLCPSTDYYSWLPVWDLQVQSPAPGTDEQMFYASQTLADSGNYTQAKTGYQQLVSTYPASKYATASLKELFSIEQGATNDYASLKNYYTGIVNQQTNDELVKISGFLSNLCDIKLENYQTAIAHYESMIQSPPSFADSLFAIIDLGNLYVQMGNDSLKSAPIGNMTEYIPVSQKQYSQYRDYLLSLLFKDDEISEENQQSLRPSYGIATLLPNCPNPFTGQNYPRLPA